MKSFEGNVASAHEYSREPENFPDLDTALSLADERVFQYATDPRDFAEPNGPYEQIDIERDLKHVEQMEQRFATGNFEQGTSGKRAREEALRKAARAFEGIVLDNCAENGWLGDPDAVEVIVPSRYDDIVNGVDGIIDFPEERKSSPLALAMDVTSSHDVSKKLTKIKDEITKGKLAEIRYLHSERMRMHGRMYDIPRVVVGADRETIRQLLEPWNARKMKTLAEHHMQYQMLDEIRRQLEVFAAYARARGDERGTRMAQIYDEDRVVINNLLAQKEEAYGSQASNKMRAKTQEDSVYQTLLKELQGFN